LFVRGAEEALQASIFVIACTCFAPLAVTGVLFVQKKIE